MPIWIEISVPPHYKGVEYDTSKTPWELKLGSRPPAIIIKKTLRTWEELLEWGKALGLKTGGGIEAVCDNVDNQYVGVELELMEVTGNQYTDACLAIEGYADDRPCPNLVSPRASDDQ
jgi:hypothetical protein